MSGLEKILSALTALLFVALISVSVSFGVLYSNKAADDEGVCTTAACTVAGALAKRYLDAPFDLMDRIIKIDGPGFLLPWCTPIT